MNSTFRLLVIAVVALLLLSAHDMFLRLDSYFLEPGTPAEISLYNGTFDHSENVIDRSRMADVTLVGGGSRTAVDSSAWREVDSTTVLSFTTGAAGTWVAGVSTRARQIDMTASDFNDYLEHEGGSDMLATRRTEGTLEQAATERYSKHVKTIFQVGDIQTVDWATPLGYPIEFVPLSNPYALHPGDELQVRLLWQGQPLANQLVLVGHSAATHDHADGTTYSHAHGADHEHAGESATSGAKPADHGHNHDHADGTTHSHAHAADHEHAGETAASSAEQTAHTHDAGTSLRTNTDGILAFPVTDDGTWHLRTIHLVKSAEAGITHESNWATLTFGMSHSQGHAHGELTHDHHEDGLPSYVYWIGSLVLVLGLFFYFKQKS